MRHLLLATTTALLTITAQAQTQTPPPTDPDAVGYIMSGFVKGYLDKNAAVDSLALLPAPPAAGSAAYAADMAAQQAAQALKGSERYRLAKSDAELRFPEAGEAFACALGVHITPKTTPNLSMLLRRTMADAGLATYKAKNHYQRQRPFVVTEGATCSPEDEAKLRKDGSYPSGHAATGWAWGLVLTEIAPDRADALAQRAYAFGQSRVVCNAHWQSDVDAGRLVASVVVAQLNHNPDFQAQLAEARREYLAEKDKGAPDASACMAEAKALH